MATPRLNAVKRELKRAQEHRDLARFYNLCSILGNDWAMFFIILGSRMTGKSYAVTEFLCQRKSKLKNLCKNYWLRISETSTKAMLKNNAKKLVDPDLYRKYNLELKTKGMDVYNTNDKKSDVFMTVAPLSQFGKLKGVGFYDKDYMGEYNIVLDEFQLEQGEKRTSFDILYNFIGMLENIARTTKNRIRVFLLGNTLEEASTILKAFNFLPEKFGRFYLKSKRCVIDNLEPTEEYLKDRKGSLADILGGDNMSNYTNLLKKDISLLHKGRIFKINSIIKFTKDTSSWYSIYDGNVIRRYKHESCNDEFNMRPYLGGYFSLERKKTIIEMYDSKVFKFDNLITQSYFEDEMKKVRKL